MTAAVGLFAFCAACYGVRRELDAKQLPCLVGMTGFVLLAQMVDCATGFGFAGHLVGASLLAILFGPFSAMLSMALVLTLQAVLFGDGASSTLGANFLTMGLVAPWCGYAVFRLLQGLRSPQLDVAQVLAVGAAAFLSSLAIAVALAVICQLPLGLILPTFVAIGLIETVLSVAVFAACLQGRAAETDRARRYGLKPVAAICLLALCFSPLSSKQPDGLEYTIAEASVHDLD